MKIKALFLVAFLSMPVLAMDIPHIVPIEQNDQDYEYVNFEPHEIYEEILAYEKETQITIDNDFVICVESDCEYFQHALNDEVFKIELKGNAARKGGVKVKGAKAGASAVNGVLKAVSKGVSAGGNLKIKGLKVNADGSYSIDELSMSFGAGVGADAPIPGKEDGKQVQRH